MNPTIRRYMRKTACQGPFFTIPTKGRKTLRERPHAYARSGRVGTNNSRREGAPHAPTTYTTSISGSLRYSLYSPSSDATTRQTKPPPLPPATESHRRRQLPWIRRRWRFHSWPTGRDPVTMMLPLRLSCTGMRTTRRWCRPAVRNATEPRDISTSSAPTAPPPTPWMPRATRLAARFNVRRVTTQSH